MKTNMYKLRTYNPDGVYDITEKDYKQLKEAIVSGNTDSTISLKCIDSNSGKDVYLKNLSINNNIAQLGRKGYLPKVINFNN